MNPNKIYNDEMLRKQKKRQRLIEQYAGQIFAGLISRSDDSRFEGARIHALEQAKLLADEVLKGENNDN